MPAPMRDSLSRCESNPYSLYSVQKRPNSKPAETAATRPINKDTLEISRDKLQKEALSRLSHKSKYFVAQSGFMRIGRVLFLGIVFPPYLLVYGIPRWVFVVALPSIFSVIGLMAGKAKQRMKKRIERVVQFTQLLLQKMQAAAMVLIQPIVNVALSIQQAIRRFGQQAIRLFSRGKAILQKPFLLLKRGRGKVKSLGSQVLQFAAKIVKGISSFPQFLKDAPHYFQQRLKEMKKLFASMKKSPLQQQFLRRWQKSHDLASEAMKRLTSRLQMPKSKIRLVLRRFSQSIKPLQTAIHAKWNRIGSFLKQKKRFLFNALGKGQAKLQNLKTGFQFSSEWLDPILKRMPSFMQQRFKKFLGHPALQKAIQTVVKGVYSLGIYLLKGIQWILRLIEMAFAFVAKIARKILALVKMTHIALDYSVYGFAAFGKGMRMGLYHLLVWLFMSGILFVWGMQSVRELTVKLIRN